MKTYIVTGGAGFIGSHLVDGLLLKGARVVVIDNLSTGKKQNLNPKAKFIKMDIRSPRLGRVFRRERPYGVFHLAAIPRVPISVEDPVGTSDVNITGTVNVFRAAKDAEAKRVVFASSSSVYGDQKKLPLRETMAPNPLSPYGLQKLVGEQFAVLFRDLYKFPVVCLRYFNVYGPRIDFDSGYSLVLGKFLKQHSEGKPLTIYGDGKQTRGFCYVEDVVAATQKGMTSSKMRGGEVINVGQSVSTSVEELARLIGGEVQYFPPRPGDVRHTKADMRRAKRLLNWEPNVTFEEGVRRTQQWFQSHG
ncbi:NAD-dependent epimerase/dehydratase family protein [Patescibacteria group bacterium]|nr:NAD-dependent epimerase/dehydratase family protein [Patescibacteria group bacterium]